MKAHMTTGCIQAPCGMGGMRPRIRPAPTPPARPSARPPRQPDFPFDEPRAEEITSLQNATVKHCVKLRTQRAYREANRSVVLAGADLVRELAHVEFLYLFHIKGSPPPTGAAASGARVVAVTEGVMSKLTGLESVGPATAAAEVALPAPADFEAWQPGSLRRLLALERCQDPGNLGTLLRTALALGWDGAFLLPGCADPFNDKAMRAGRGACFKLPVASGTLDDWHRITAHHGLARVAADLDRHRSSGGLDDGNGGGGARRGLPVAVAGLEDPRVSLVLGSEGQGVSPEALAACESNVAIPMLGDMESLNVAAAGAILMWALSGAAGALAADLAAAVADGGDDGGNGSSAGSDRAAAARAGA